jgi:hypothetical protein
MHIKLTEYIGAVQVRVELRDAPLTMLPAAKDAFVRLCDALDEPAVDHDFSGLIREVDKGVLQGLGIDVGDEKPAEPDPAAEPARRRGRPPKKAELVANPADEPPFPLEEPAAREGEQGQGETVETPATSHEPTADPNPENVSSSTPTEETSPALSDITDRDLQDYCAKVAAKYGGAQKLFEIAGQFVPDGAVARPTNIRDQAQRHAFIAALEADSGVKWHG